MTTSLQNPCEVGITHTTAYVWAVCGKRMKWTSKQTAAEWLMTCTLLEETIKLYLCVTLQLQLSLQMELLRKEIIH